MKFRKIATTFLAMAMAATLTAPAFASSAAANKVQVEGAINLPTINVVLPTTASMTLNPYKLNVKLDKNDTTGSEDQIISPLMTVKNLSNIGVQVGATVTGTLGKGSTATFKNATAAAVTTGKEVFVYVKFLIGDSDMEATDITAEASPATGGMVVILSDTETDVVALKPSIAADTTNKTNILAATSDTKNPAEDGVLGFRFFGDMSKVTDWTDKDTVGATIAFTFTPVAGILPA